nr:uncharacterized protein LOC112288857 isoform X2 [Physcomitrium patens]|eukprot:XP_024389296.1 uncharacterized protein LOC112288857 isoform X2 [Physcomitrella patens]
MTITFYTFQFEIHVWHRRERVQTHLSPNYNLCSRSHEPQPCQYPQAMLVEPARLDIKQFSVFNSRYVAAATKRHEHREGNERAVTSFGDVQLPSANADTWRKPNGSFSTFCFPCRW